MLMSSPVWPGHFKAHNGIQFETALSVNVPYESIKIYWNAYLFLDENFFWLDGAAVSIDWKLEKKQ